MVSSPVCDRHSSDLQAGHAWLSQHYRWGLSKLFEEKGHTHAIILEDDMLFSPDFLTMFEVRPQSPTFTICSGTCPHTSLHKPSSCVLITFQEGDACAGCAPYKRRDLFAASAESAE